MLQMLKYLKLFILRIVPSRHDQQKQVISHAGLLVEKFNKFLDYQQTNSGTTLKTCIPTFLEKGRRHGFLKEQQRMAIYT